VLQAACELFAVRGFHGTSMKDIAHAVQLRAPSLYNHVSSKQDILFTIMDTAMDRALDAQETALRDVSDVSEQLRRATESLVLDFLRFPHEVTVCNAEIHSLDDSNRPLIIAKRDQYGKQVRAIIEHGCGAGRFTTSSPRLAAYAVLEMGNSAKAWFRPGGPLPDTEVAEQYGEFALGIVGDTTRR
jgi:AcrR family transcriptional regulator